MIICSQVVEEEQASVVSFLQLVQVSTVLLKIKLYHFNKKVFLCDLKRRTARSVACLRVSGRWIPSVQSGGTGGWRGHPYPISGHTHRVQVQGGPLSYMGVGHPPVKFGLPPGQHLGQDR